MTAKPDTTKESPRLLEIVLKCDSIGSLEAVTSALNELSTPEVEIRIIHGGIGDISKSDVMLAETAGRLIVGFQVGVTPGLEKEVRDQRVEVRIYSVIYTLMEDIRALASSLIPSPFSEEIIGSAQVIALFKSTRKGIIIGCEVRKGVLAVGQRFRIISAMGPVYEGSVESMHIGDHAVQKATVGQQAGIKIRDFNAVRVGDLVETFRPSPAGRTRWEAAGRILRP